MLATARTPTQADMFAILSPLATACGFIRGTGTSLRFAYVAGLSTGIILDHLRGRNAFARLRHLFSKEILWFSQSTS